MPWLISYSRFKHDEFTYNDIFRKQLAAQTEFAYCVDVCFGCVKFIFFAQIRYHFFQQVAAYSANENKKNMGLRMGLTMKQG